MKRITVRLTDEEYAEIEAVAQAEHRTVPQQIAHMATQKPLIHANWTWYPQTLPAPNTLHYWNAYDTSAANGTLRVSAGDAVAAGSITYTGQNILTLQPGATLSAETDA